MSEKKCYYLGEFEADVDYEGFITMSCFHPASHTDLKHPTDCPMEFGGDCLFEGGPFDGPVDEDKNSSG